MAGNFNRVLLMGNLTRDIELRHTSNNTAIAKIGLAINRRFSVGEGANRENREETTFVDCEAWGRTAEVMAQYLSKGRPVFIEGRLKLDQWQDKETGQNRSRMVVVVENFQFVDSKGGGGGGGGGGNDEGGYSGSGGQRRSSGGGRSSSGGGGGGGGGDGDDDIPF